MSVEPREHTAHVPRETPRRVADAAGNTGCLLLQPQPRAGRTTTLDPALESGWAAQALSQSARECLQGWRFHHLPGQPEGSVRGHLQLSSRSDTKLTLC